MNEELSQDTLKYAERLAAAAFTEQEMSISLEIELRNIKAWMQDRQHPFFKAVMKGKLETQLQLRERILKDASNGSSPAQTLAIKIIEDSDLRSKMRN
jgi:hypothetical protein